MDHSFVIPHCPFCQITLSPVGEIFTCKQCVPKYINNNFYYFWHSLCSVRFNENRITVSNIIFEDIHMAIITYPASNESSIIHINKNHFDIVHRLPNYCPNLFTTPLSELKKRIQLYKNFS